MGAIRTNVPAPNGPPQATSSRSPRLVTPELELIQPLVQPTLGQQGLVGAPFPHLPVVQNEDLVGVQDGAEPV